MQITRFEDYKILLRENTLPAFNMIEIYPLNSLGYPGNFSYVTWIAVLQSRVNTRPWDNLAQSSLSRYIQFISCRRKHEIMIPDLPCECVIAFFILMALA